MPGETLLHVERVLLLKKTPPLDTLPSPLLAILAEYARERHVPQGTVLLKPGEPAGGIYFVADGRIRVRAHGREFVMAHRGAGVGGLELLSRGDQSLEVVAETDALVLELDAFTVAELFEEHFAIFHHVLRGLSAQLVKLRSDLPEVSLAAAPRPAPVTGTERDLDLVERIFFLRQMPPFVDSSISALAELARGVNQMRFDPGVRLWSEGDAARMVFMILSGRVSCPTTRNAHRGVAVPGTALGALEAMGELPRWHDAITETPVVALAGDVEMLLDVFEDNLAMGLDYLALIAGWTVRIFEAAPHHAAAQAHFEPEPAP